MKVSFTQILDLNVELVCQKCGAELKVSGEKEGSEADVALLVALHECVEKREENQRDN